MINDTAGNVRSGAQLPWLLLLFVGSGGAALIYEIVWLQMLQLVIGMTTVSLGLLLGTFMGGMCLGSLGLPRLVSARRHPLRVYALLEVGIGAIGIAILFVVPSLSQFYSAHAGSGLPGMLSRGVVAVLCLLPPTVLMGATLPAMARWVEATPQGISWLGYCYGGNIAGAVCGCLLAGFYLLRVHDMATATYVAAAINGAVALIGFGLAARTPCKSDASPVSPAHEPHPLTPSLSPNGGEGARRAGEGAAPLVQGRAAGFGSGCSLPGAKGEGAPGSWSIYVAIAISGLAALGAEVVWTRLLSLLLGGTVYTFSIILAMFLVGLGIGSGAGSLLLRSGVRPRLALGCCQILSAAAVAWTACMIARSLPYWPINPSLSKNPWFNFQLDLARCLWAVLPAAMLWGASFPLALAAVAPRQQEPGRLVGNVYAANTLGAIVGALAFSLVVVPWVGTQWAQRLLIGLSAAAALLLLAPLVRGVSANTVSGDERGRSGVSFTGASALLAALGLAAVLAWQLAPAPWGLTAYGRFMATYAYHLSPRIVEEKDVPSGGGPPDMFCTYLGEGLNGSVAVSKWTSGVRAFHSAGKIQASSEPHDMRLQRLLGHLSALAHRRPESVLVVACGAGVTAGTFVVHPQIKRIVICDIEPLVPQVVAPMFEKENYGVVKDPRTQVVLDDGRHFIRTTREKFDIITSDPIDPWVKGCAALNTVEYYAMCKAHLKPGGVMTLWIPLYESDTATAKSVIATFFKAFPHGILWSNDSEGEGYDAVLLGQVEPTQFDLDELQARLSREDHARVKQSLQEVGFPSAMSLLATYAGQARDLQGWLRDAQINTDGNLRLQYLAGLALNSYMSSEIREDIGRYYTFPENVFVGSDLLKQLLKSHLGESGAVQAAPAQKDANSASGSKGLSLAPSNRRR